jgi:hypothetical protein
MAGMAAAAIPLLGMGGDRQGAIANPTSQSSGAQAGATLPGLAAGDAAEAAVCRADYEGLEAAVAEYRLLNGKPPQNVSALQSFLKDPVSSKQFTISLDAHHDGVVEVAAGGRPAAPGDGNCDYAG